MCSEPAGIGPEKALLRPSSALEPLHAGRPQRWASIHSEIVTDPAATQTTRRHEGRGIQAWIVYPAALAVAGFLLVRAIGVLALTWAPARAGRPPIEVLASWDGGWYLRIAANGYADRLDLSTPMTDQITGSLAFFPIYPLLIRFVSGLTGANSAWAGVVISLVAGAVAAAGIAVLASDWAGPRVGVLAALLWAAAPMGVVASMVYTEALFTAVVVWTFVALRRNSWVLVAVLGLAAGLTRPTGIALGTAVAVYVIGICWRARGRETREPESDSPGVVVPVVAAGLALAGTPLFWLWVAYRAGRWDAWFAVQDAFWGSRFDGGASLMRLVGSLLRGQPPPDVSAMAVTTLMCLLAAASLLVLAVRARVWWPMLVYTAISLAMVIGSAGYFSSKLRFLVPMFVLAFPVAHWLAGRSRLIQVIAVVAAVAATTVSGTWLLLSWPYAI